MATQTAIATRSVGEIADEISRLSAADRVKLVKAANYFSRHWTMHPDDLLQEAMSRALAGTRHCPANLDIVGFLIGVMRSLCSTALRSMKREPPLYVVPMIGEGDPEEASFDPVDPTPNPEEIICGERAVEQLTKDILKLYEDDPTCQVLVEGIMEGMEGKELQELAGLTDKELATKRKFIRRRFDKAFPNRGKP